MMQPLLQYHHQDWVTVITIELMIILMAPVAQINPLQILATSQQPVTLLVQLNSTNQMSDQDTVQWCLGQHLLHYLRWVYTLTMSFFHLTFEQMQAKRKRNSQSSSENYSMEMQQYQQLQHWPQNY